MPFEFRAHQQTDTRTLTNEYAGYTCYGSNRELVVKVLDTNGAQRLPVSQSNQADMLLASLWAWLAHSSSEKQETRCLHSATNLDCPIVARAGCWLHILRSLAKSGGLIWLRVVVWTGDEKLA